MIKPAKYPALCLAIGMTALSLFGCNTGTPAGVNTSRKAAAQAVYQKAPSPAATDGSKILFVGNSHTFVNDVPGIFMELAYEAGYEVDIYELSEGMYTLEQFADPDDELGAMLISALTTEAWDFVVLQENTSRALSGKAEKEMYPYARTLDEMIRAAGGQTAFMMTWPMEKGMAFLSREAMLVQLSEGYQNIAKELDALLIPGGEVFLKALNQIPDLQLWGDDGQHTSEEGAYLAACTAYAVLFQESPEGNAYLHGLDQETAGKLQAVAAEMILTK